MKKIAVVTDSNSGIRQDEAKLMGIRVLPMPFMVDGQDFLEGIDLTQDILYEKLASGSEVSTSQPLIGMIVETWDELLKEYDELVHIPMSSGLSTSCEMASTMAEEYGGRVQVVDNKRISVTLRNSIEDALLLAEAGYNASQIKERLEETALESSIYLMVDTLKYLKKGGRVTPAAAAIGTVLQIKPVLQVHGGKLDAYAKARGTKHARKLMIDAIDRDMKTRFAEHIKAGRFGLLMAYSANLDAANDFKEEVMSAFPGFDIKMEELSMSIACHTGPGVLAVAGVMIVRE